MAKTYEPITRQTLGSSQTTVTLNSIPATYTDLVLVVVSANSSSANNGRFFFNNDTSALYSNTTLYGNGSSAASSRITNATYSYTPDIATSHYSPTIIHIMNYANTTTFKSFLIRGGASDTNTALWAGLYRSTNAISRIDFQTFGGDVYVGSTFTLYGIKAA